MRLNVFCAAMLALLLLLPVRGWSADTKVEAKADAKADAKVDDTTGTWTAESAEMAGMAMPSEFCKGIKLVIKGDKYKMTVNNQVEEGTSKADATVTPKTLDVMGNSGPNKGKTLKAIYELDGDKLKVCYDLSGSARPTEFKTSAGTQQFMVTYKKSKG